MALSTFACSGFIVNVDLSSIIFIIISIYHFGILLLFIITTYYKWNIIFNHLLHLYLLNDIVRLFAFGPILKLYSSTPLEYSSRNKRLFVINWYLCSTPLIPVKAIFCSYKSLLIIFKRTLSKLLICYFF
jgi:hypothetical protein